MDFNDTPEEAAFRKEARTWLEANGELRDPNESALGVLSDGSLVGANREWIFHGKPGAPMMQRSTVESRGQPVMPPNSITVGPGDLVIWGEYNPQTGHGTPVRIYVSEDGGRCYDVAHVIEAGSVMHVHSIFFDAAYDQFWVVTGDYDEEPGIGILSRDFTRFEWFAKGEQQYRLCEPFDFGDRFVYATDTPLARNAVISIDKDTGATTRLLEVEGSALYACRFGGLCAFSTTVEPSPLSTSTS